MFWFEKANIMLSQPLTTYKQEEQQAKRLVKISVSLDYYFSAVKINPSHFSSVYNIGYCYYISGKYANSEKWFEFANKIEPSNQDC